MSYGTRPFGVSILLGGNSTDKPELIQIQTNGDAQGVKASAIGKDSAKIQAFLEENYNVDALDSEAAAVTMAIKAFLHAGELTAKEVEITVLLKKYKQYSQQDKQTAIESII